MSTFVVNGNDFSDALAAVAINGQYVRFELGNNKVTIRPSGDRIGCHMAISVPTDIVFDEENSLRLFSLTKKAANMVVKAIKKISGVKFVVNSAGTITVKDLSSGATHIVVGYSKTNGCVDYEQRNDAHGDDIVDGAVDLPDGFMTRINTDLSHAVSKDYDRPAMQNICICSGKKHSRPKDGGVFVVATDGHRLAQIVQNIDIPVDAPDYFITKPTCNTLARLEKLRKNDRIACVIDGENNIRFRVGYYSGVVTGDRVGTYPTVDFVIEDANKRKRFNVEVGSNVISDLLKPMVGSLPSGKGVDHQVAFDVSRNGYSLGIVVATASSFADGNNVIKVELPIMGPEPPEGVDVGNCLSVPYFMDMLKQAEKNETIVMGFALPSDSKSVRCVRAVTFKMSKFTNYLLMPILEPKHY